MEGVAFAAARNLRIMAAAGKTRLWLEIKASLYGCPILTTAADESGGLGCAMLAGTGIGLYADLGAAAARLVRHTGKIPPNPRWADTYARLAPVFEQVYENGRTIWSMLEAAEATAGPPSSERC